MIEGNTATKSGYRADDRSNRNKKDLHGHCLSMPRLAFLATFCFVVSLNFWQPQNLLRQYTLERLNFEVSMSQVANGSEKSTNLSPSSLENKQSTTMINQGRDAVFDSDQAASRALNESKLVTPPATWKMLLQPLLRAPSQMLVTSASFQGMNSSILEYRSKYKAEFDSIDQNAVNITDHSFCLDWSVESDLWWTHHPEWELSNDMETDTHYCFKYISNPEKADLMRKLYENQFGGNCSNQVPLKMWSSGWNADLLNVADSLHKALVWAQRPLQINQYAWHYAAPDANNKGNKIPSPPACPTMNMNCYFLEISDCPSLDKKTFQVLQSGDYPAMRGKSPPGKNHPRHFWYRDYATRPQLWLRKQIRSFVQNQTIIQPCTAIHVRRTDVVLHGKTSRKYHAISEYMNATAMNPSLRIQPNILLLTDDQNAIGEAETMFPGYNWMYLDRPRWKGTEGGWERQIPSSQPIFEIVVLQSTFRLVQQCENLVRTQSGFGRVLEHEFKGVKPSGIVVDIDSGINVHSAEHQDSSSISKEYKPNSTKAMGVGETRESNNPIIDSDQDSKGVVSESWKVRLGEFLRAPSQMLVTSASFDGMNSSILEYRSKYKAEFDSIDQNALHITNHSFCLDWSVESDLWWTHHPEWELSNDMETDTHYCFKYISNPEKADLMRKLYENQFGGNCSNQVPLGMWSSGWNADLLNVADSLHKALVWAQRPLQINQYAWHYAAPDANNKGNKIPSPPACPTMNMNCYFLEISDCPHLLDKKTLQLNSGDYPAMPGKSPPGKNHPRHFWYRDYATRPQLWLRKQIRGFVQNQTIIQPCTAIHVRRTDVVLHGRHSRKYHAISEYMNATAMNPSLRIQPNILLLTDDQNAIGEAETMFPGYNWMYLDRPRWKGTEGGWERQIPSSQPIFEMVVLQSTFRLVQQCENLVRTQSGFGRVLEHEFKGVKPSGIVVDIDSGINVHGAEHQDSSSISKEYKPNSTKAMGVGETRE